MGGGAGLEVRLGKREVLRIVGPCPFHGLCPISRDSIERHYVDECCDLFAFLNHYAILCARRVQSLSIQFVTESSYKGVN